MPDDLMPIQPCDPQRWLEQALAPGSTLSFTYAGYGGDSQKPYITGRRVLDVHLLWLIEKGSFPILIGDKTIVLEPGTLMWIPPGIVHDTVVPGAIVQYGLRISLMRGTRQLGLTLPPMVIRNCGDLAPLFVQTIAAHLRSGPTANCASGAWSSPSALRPSRARPNRRAWSADWAMTTVSGWRAWCATTARIPA